MKNGSLVNLQYLRAIAALMVVWFHARNQADWLKLQFPSDFGEGGVDLFFVISGFIMVYTTHGKDISPQQFFIRRLQRIVPLYWVATVGVVCVALVAPTLLRSTVVSWPHVISSLLFFPMLSPAFPDKYWPLIIPGWTLNYEMMFYLIFSISLILKGSQRLIALFIALGCLVGFGYMNSWVGLLGFYSNSIMLIFLLGAMFGYLYINGVVRLDSLMAWAVVLMAIMLFIFLRFHPVGGRVVDAGIPAAILVAGFCMLPTLFENHLKWLSRLGDASYSIYLSHVFTLVFFRTVSSKLGFVVDSNSFGWMYMIANLGAAAICGLLVYYFVERPLSNMSFRLANSLKLSQKF
jgi:exopolysaccharide production protein ExoZ